jgi:hypothetical protein
MYMYMYMQVGQLLFQELLFIIYYTILSYYNVKRKYYLSNSAVCFWYYKIVIYTQSNAAFVCVNMYLENNDPGYTDSSR